MDEPVKCLICKKCIDGEGDVVTLKENGREGIKRAIKGRNDTITAVPGQQVHQNSRREYCHQYCHQCRREYCQQHQAGSKRCLV